MVQQHLLFLFLFIGTATVVSAGYPYKKQTHQTDRSIKDGDVLQGVLLTPFNINLPATGQPQRYVFSFYGPEGYAIHAIQVIDLDTGGNNNWPAITHGGIRTHFVEIGFTSKAQHGIIFRVKIYASKKMDDIREGLRRPVPGPDSRLNDLIEGSPESPGSKLLSPKHAVVRNGQDEIYSCSDPSKIVAALEVLDYGSKGCEPVISSGGVGKHHVTVKCKTKMRKKNAHFIVKVYVKNGKRQILGEIHSSSPSKQPGPSNQPCPSNQPGPSNKPSPRNQPGPSIKHPGGQGGKYQPRLLKRRGDCYYDSKYSDISD